MEMNEKLFIDRRQGPPSESHIFLRAMKEFINYKLRLGEHHRRVKCVNWIHRMEAEAFISGMIMELYETDMKGNYQKLNCVSSVNSILKSSLISPGWISDFGGFVYCTQYKTMTLVAGISFHNFLWERFMIIQLDCGSFEKCFSVQGSPWIF